MTKFEKNYISLIHKILDDGEDKEGRNGVTHSIFGEMLDLGNISEEFPILQGRQMFYKGVLGELAAMLRQPKTLRDFENQGCTYWSKWAKEDGSINVDYGNKWFDFNGFNQIDALRKALLNNPNDRRMIVTSWDPSNLENLDLPCCHYTYQFHVSHGDTLNMLWTQRSVDTMIGLPSDAIFAAAWLILIANEVGMKPGNIKMSLGDTHIYREHMSQVFAYLTQADRTFYDKPKHVLKMLPGAPMETFTNTMLTLPGYNHANKINFILKA